MKFPGFRKPTDSTPQKGKKLPKKSLFRRINDWLHLWMGLISGIIVIIISITGCLYAFEKEISDWLKPYRFVTAQEKSYMLPSAMKGRAEEYINSQIPDSVVVNIYDVTYFGKNKSAVVAYNHPEHEYTMIYMNPYDGTILKQDHLKYDFFRIVLMGHFYLWLPPDIGQPVVATAILIFVFLLITGMVMWWPKNLKKANFDKSFKIKWNGTFKRVNYDMHNVLGFYFLTIALILALTGLVWGFQWFSKTYYWTLTGGKSIPEWKTIESDTTQISATNMQAQHIDIVWQKMLKEYEGQEGNVGIQFPRGDKGTITFNFNGRPGTYYKREAKSFDQYTLKELPPSSELYGKKFDEYTLGQKIYKMNYDIHVGAVLGLPGKILAFFASLVCASLPVTGFIIWWGKRKKGNKKPIQRKKSKTASSISEETKN